MTVSKHTSPPAHRLYSKPEKLINIYRWIEQYQVEHRRPPTIREIMDGIGISSSSVVRYYILKMVELGMVHYDRNISRGLSLLELSEAHPKIQEILIKEN